MAAQTLIALLGFLLLRRVAAADLLVFRYGNGLLRKSPE